MNEKQIQELIKQMKSQFKVNYKNKSDEEIEHMILDVFFQAFCEKKIDRKDLTTLTEALGYQVNNDVIDKIEKEQNK